MSEIEITPTELTTVRWAVQDHWTPGHPVGRANDVMGAFYLQTPWVDRRVFPHGVSALVAKREGKALGISCVQVTPDAAWHIIWLVTPEAKGQGIGRKLLLAMREAVAPKPLYVFGISKDGMPQYEKTKFQTGIALRRRLMLRGPYVSEVASVPLDLAWTTYRFHGHPFFKYEQRGDTIVREDLNEWGKVLHVVHVGRDWPTALRSLVGMYDLVQAWGMISPGFGWEVPPATIPTVFHPPEARGNTLGVAGWPELPPEIHAEDGMQGRWT